MESPFTEYEWRIKDLEKENTKLKERINFLGDLVFKARNLAKEVVKYYPSCPKSNHDMAKEFLEVLNEEH